MVWFILINITNPRREPYPARILTGAAAPKTDYLCGDLCFAGQAMKSGAKGISRMNTDLGLNNEKSIIQPVVLQLMTLGTFHKIHYALLRRFASVKHLIALFDYRKLHSVF